MRTQICALALGLVLSLAASSANAQTPQQANAAKLIQLVLVIMASEQRDAVNINEANASTIQDELLGIDENLSQAIVDFRQDNGPFESLLDLLEIDGMNKSLIIQNQRLITL